MIEDLATIYFFALILFLVIEIIVDFTRMIKNGQCNIRYDVSPARLYNMWRKTRDRLSNKPRHVRQAWEGLSPQAHDVCPTPKNGHGTFKESHELKTKKGEEE